ncbi:MAG: aminotransferase class I/II-fold pyridoxal phosphate-dependent enzyme [Oscillospiraceae bacterium]|jgi:cystathionine beta-lyase|nr:aminotransferase class I/II-fold pyridoxal phosphate-dependent enzyme [Oscillospiraceae bacterium]
MYNFDTAVDRRGTGSIKWDTVSDDVIAMSIADADWATCPAVTDAVRALLDSRSVFGYSFGDSGLADAVVEWYSRKFGLTIERDWVIAHSGIVPALATLSRLSDGYVLAAEPNYSMLLTAPARIGRTLVRVPLEERLDGYRLSYHYDFDALESRVGGAGILYLCNPHNPVGTVYTRDELQRIAEFAARHGLITVSDEIHCELTFGKRHVPWFDVEPLNSVTLIAPGKVCNMPGIPIGLAIVPNAELRQKVRQLLGHGNGALNSAAAAGAFSAAADSWKAAQASYLAANNGYLADELHKRLPKARLTRNDGTYLQWLDLSAYELGDAKKYLLERARVDLSVGADFGGTASHVRLNFATTRERLTAALDRIESALEGSDDPRRSRRRA